MTDHTRVGELLTEDQPRDAIHIAVAAVVATEKLVPGQNIGFVEGDSHDHNLDVAACERAMSVGIVDPFLQKPVLPGQRFYMFLHPNTITSLRHNWTHPAFGGEPADFSVRKGTSQEWMDEFGAKFGYSGNKMIQAGKEWVKAGDYFSDGGTFEGEIVPGEYWEHFEVLTGLKVDASDRQSFFSCSC